MRARSRGRSQRSLRSTHARQHVAGGKVAGPRKLALPGLVPERLAADAAARHDAASFARCACHSGERHRVEEAERVEEQPPREAVEWRGGGGRGRRRCRKAGAPAAAMTVFLVLLHCYLLQRSGSAHHTSAPRDESLVKAGGAGVWGSKPRRAEIHDVAPSRRACCCCCCCCCC